MGGTIELESAGLRLGSTARLVLAEFRSDHEGTNPELRPPG